jgi:hypothetical protein
MIAVGLALASVSAPVQASDDPAIAACEGTVLYEVPFENYRRISARIDRNVVSIGYQLSTASRPDRARCPFKFAAGKGWEFDTSSSPEAAACMTHSEQVAAMMRAGAMTRAKRERPRLEECLALLKSEQLHQIKIVLATHALMSRSAYPIPAEGTALKRR